MKCLPGLYLLLSMLLSPSLCWADETADGTNGEATTEQTGGAGSANGQSTQDGSEVYEEEPDCE